MHEYITAEPRCVCKVECSRVMYVSSIKLLWFVGVQINLKKNSF